jgi:hypothetical protein
MFVARGLKPAAVDLYNAACARNVAMIELFCKTGLKRGTNLQYFPPFLNELTINCRSATGYKGGLF